jgi:hypothetical protein
VLPANDAAEPPGAQGPAGCSIQQFVAPAEAISNGWPSILSSLKRLIETGTPLERSRD